MSTPDESGWPVHNRYNEDGGARTVSRKDQERMAVPQAGSVDLEVLLGQAFVASPQAVVLSNAARKIVAANAAASALFGYGIAAMTGRPVREFYAVDEDWSAISRALQEPAASGSNEPIAVTMRSGSGGLFDASVSAVALFAGDGAMLGVIETIRPGDHNKKAGHAPRDTGPADHAVRLARGIAHDFNNLLAIIGGNVQLAGQRNADPVSAAFLREAELACEMGARLTQRIMTFAENRHLKPVEIDIKQLLDTQFAMLQRVLGDRIRLSLDTGDPLPPVFADRSALENAILNLALNARDAMPDGGSAVTRTTLDTVSGQVCIAFQDTGTGMTPRVVARAFDPFFTTKDPGRGTGLGLASVEGFAKQSGGGVAIESTPGRGTTVSMYLPVYRPAGAKPAPSR